MGGMHLRNPQGNPFQIFAPCFEILVVASTVEFELTQTDHGWGMFYEGDCVTMCYNFVLLSERFVTQFIEQFYYNKNMKKSKRAEPIA